MVCIIEKEDYIEGFGQLIILLQERKQSHKRILKISLQYLAFVFLMCFEDADSFRLSYFRLAVRYFLLNYSNCRI